MNNFDIGIDTAKQILNTVNSAVQSQQYGNLAHDIKDTVNTARSQIQSNAAQQQREQEKQRQQMYERQQAYQRQQAARQASQTRQQHSAGMQYTNVRQTEEVRTPFFQKKVSRGAGLGSIIGGSIGLFFMLFPMIGFFVGRLITGSTGLLVVSGVFTVFAVLFGWLIGRGVRLQRLTERYFDYGTIAENAEYLPIDKLSRLTGRSEAKVLSDFKELKRRGYLPYMMLDKDEKTVLLTEAAYQQYASLEARRHAFETEKTAFTEEQKRAQSQIDDSDLPEEVKELLSEGHAYLLRVRNYNDEIPDTEQMSTKLYELESIMKRIFEQVKREPERAKDLRKFMTYYLPTTDKLLASYVEVNKQGTDGDNIRATKAEIESAMDVINDAFENLLDKMFEDTAWDVSSDISVMKTMMAQDGLTRTEKVRVEA